MARIISTFTVLVLAASAVTPAIAVASLIEYDLLALGDSAYRYEYTIVNDTPVGLGTDVQAFALQFDTSLYDEFSLTPVTAEPLANEWDERILASAPGVPAAYDALAMGRVVAAGATLSGFQVEFDWLGGRDEPGPQPFTVYDPSTFDTLAAGVSEPRNDEAQAVPAPSGLFLMGAALLAMALSGTSRGWRDHR